MTPKDGIVFDALPFGQRGGTMQPEGLVGEWRWVPVVVDGNPDIEIG